MGKSSKTSLKARKALDRRGRKTQDLLTPPQVHSNHCTREQGPGCPQKRKKKKRKKEIEEEGVKR